VTSMKMVRSLKLNQRCRGFPTIAGYCSCTHLIAHHPQCGWWVNICVWLSPARNESPIYSSTLGIGVSGYHLLPFRS
jgi:hypothetical protein